MSNFVKLEGVDLRYGGTNGVLALNGTDIEINRGEFAAVVGPSGCGKSSLMKLVTGLTPPTAGKITVAGQDVVGPLKCVGMAFQNPTLLPWRKQDIQCILGIIQKGSTEPLNLLVGNTTICIEHRFCRRDFLSRRCAYMRESMTT